MEILCDTCYYSNFLMRKIKLREFNNVFVPYNYYIIELGLQPESNLKVISPGTVAHAYNPSTLGG